MPDIAIPRTDSHMTCYTDSGVHVTCSADTDSHKIYGIRHFFALYSPWRKFPVPKQLTLSSENSICQSCHMYFYKTLYFLEKFNGCMNFCILHRHFPTSFLLSVTFVLNALHVYKTDRICFPRAAKQDITHASQSCICISMKYYRKFNGSMKFCPLCRNFPMPKL